MKASLSILGVYNQDNTIFDGVVLPGTMDKDVLIANILYEGASLEVYYPDPDFLKMMIAQWSKVNQYVWGKLWDTTQVEYNPIFNYDRTEEWEDTENRKAVGADKETRDLRTEFNNKTSSNSNSETKGKDSVENFVSGYNDNELVPREKDTSAPESNTKLNSGGSNNGESLDKGTVDRKREDSEDKTALRKGREFGNIGVTTTQQMLQAERDIVQFNMYTYITDSFIDRFCLMVYS